MKKVIAIVLAVLFIFPAGITVSSATTDDARNEAALENPDFELEMYVSNSSSSADEVLVTITISNIVPDKGLILLHFLLYYDTSKVEPIVMNDGMENAAMDDFLIFAPDLEKWQDGALCKLNENEGFYDISFLTAENSDYAKEDYSLMFAIPFRVKRNAMGIIEFQIPNGSTTYGVSDTLGQVFGNGDTDIVIVGGDIPLVSALSLSGIGMPGQTLTANVSGISANNLVYLWYIDSALVPGNYSNTYTVTEEDVGKTIYVVAYGINDYGGVIESSGITIATQINTAPPAPSFYRKSSNEIMLWPYDCCEYKMEGRDWQNSPVFTNLTPGNTYTFYVRYKTPAGSQVAPASQPFTVKLTNGIVGIVDDETSPDYGYLCGLPEKLTYDAFIEIMGSTANVFDEEGNVIGSNRYIGTGMYFYNGLAFTPIVIKGDLNGDGKVTSVDALRLKKSILHTLNLEGAYLRAACIGGRKAPYSNDYMKLKKHIIGNYNLYE